MYLSTIVTSCICLLVSLSHASPAPAPPAQQQHHQHDQPSPPPQHVLTDTNTIEITNSELGKAINRIPTRHESTILARRLLSLSHTGVLTTTFPSNLSSTPYGPPQSLSNTPIGLPEYIASCEEPSGNPTMIALTVSTSTRNVFAGSNVSLSLSWWDEYVKLTGHQPWSTANLPRVSLTGWLQEISREEVEAQGVVGCFTDLHPDAKWWLPGDEHSAHSGIWMRLVVEQIYWIGGFGDRAYIGWFDPEDWRAVKREEWEAVRLPGEN